MVSGRWMGLNDIEFDMAEVETANDGVEEGEEDRERDGDGNGDGSMGTEMEMEMEMAIWRQRWRWKWRWQYGDRDGDGNMETGLWRVTEGRECRVISGMEKQQEADEREARWRISERRGGRDMIKALEERWRISERRGGREKMKEWGMKWMSKRAEMAGRGLEEF